MHIDLLIHHLFIVAYIFRLKNSVMRRIRYKEFPTFCFKKNKPHKRQLFLKMSSNHKKCYNLIAK